MNWGMCFVQGIELLFLGIGSWFDMKTRELPTVLFLIFGFLSAACNIFFAYQKVSELLGGFAVGLLFFVIGKVTKEAVGYGDGAGLCILGIFEGFQGVFSIAFAAFCLSACYGLCKMLFFKKSLYDTLPFYPFLFLALIGVILL